MTSVSPGERKRASHADGYRLEPGVKRSLADSRNHKEARVALRQRRRACVGAEAGGKSKEAGHSGRLRPAGRCPALCALPVGQEMQGIGDNNKNKSCAWLFEGKHLFFCRVRNKIHPKEQQAC
jgi:hypothetical protein